MIVASPRSITAAELPASPALIETIRSPLITKTPGVCTFVPVNSRAALITVTLPVARARHGISRAAPAAAAPIKNWRRPSSRSASSNAACE
jgi:hypothetical protein